MAKNKKKKSKGERLGWTPIHLYQPIKITEELLEVKYITEEDLKEMGINKDKNDYLIP